MQFSRVCLCHSCGAIHVLPGQCNTCQILALAAGLPPQHHSFKQDYSADENGTVPASQGVWANAVAKHGGKPDSRRGSYQGGQLMHDPVAQLEQDIVSLLLREGAQTTNDIATFVFMQHESLVPGQDAGCLPGSCLDSAALRASPLVNASTYACTAGLAAPHFQLIILLHACTASNLLSTAAAQRLGHQPAMVAHMTPLVQHDFGLAVQWDASSYAANNKQLFTVNGDLVDLTPSARKQYGSPLGEALAELGEAAYEGTAEQTGRAGSIAEQAVASAGDGPPYAVHPAGCL